MAKKKRTPLQKRLRRLEVRLQGDPRVQRAWQGVLQGYLRLIRRTGQWRTLGLDAYRILAHPEPVIMCGWHGNLAGTLFIAEEIDRDILALASDHADGMLIVEMIRAMGHDAVLLSTSRDKTGPLRDALRHLRAGACLGIATDGPMGPAHLSKAGAVTLASLSGVPLVPVGFAARPKIRLGTWDRFVLALPFCRAVLSAGEPMVVPRRLSEEATDAWLARLDRAIQAETDRCSKALKSKRS